MAKLVDDRLELEVSYRGYEHGWIDYGFDCRWGDEAIFDDRPLKRSPSGWASRGAGQMLGNSDGACCLLPFLNDVLCKREADYVTPIEPDFTLAIWPRDMFPFLPSKWTLRYESEEFKRAREEREAAREQAGGILDSDRVQLILAFDAYQFRGSSYQTSGPAIHMFPTWGALREFAQSLREDFRRFALDCDL